MSISSCPRCARQVTLPVGVSNDAKVRCPLCNAQYALSEAWLAMPPLLEVIEDERGGAPADGFDFASEYQPDDSPLAAGTHRVESPGESSTANGAGQPGELDEGLEFEAFEIEHDDMVMQDQDTEVEDLGFATSDPQVRAVPEEIEHIDVAGPNDESVLDLGHPTPTHDLAAHESAGNDEPTLEFDEVQFAAQPTEGEPGEIDFGAPQSVDAGEEVEIDFGDMQDSAEPGAGPSIDFGEPSPNEPSPEDEIGLDFGEPVAAPATAETHPAPAKSKGKKGQKAKKEPTQKPPKTKSGSQRSLVGRLMSVVLSGLVAVPLAYYVGLWISPDYDILKIGGKLPAFMAPPGAKRSPTIAQATTAMPHLPPPAVQETVADASPPAPEAAAATETPTDEAPPLPSAEKPSQEPPAPVPAEKDLQAPPEPVTDAAESEPQDLPPAPIESAADDSAAKGTPAEEKPQAAPTATADPVDDLISPAGKKQDESPADEAPEEMPAEDSNAAVPGPLDDVDAKPDLGPLDDPAGAKPGDSTAEVTARAAEPVESAEALGPRDAREFTPADLLNAMHEASRANDKMVAAQSAKDEAEIKKVRASFYLSLYGLADVVTFAKDDELDPKIDAERQGLEQAVLQMAADPQRLKAMKVNAAKWLKYTKRTTPGIILAGTVQGVEPMGKLYQIQLRLTADAPLVTVISPTNPRLSPQDEAVTLGSIVEDPEQQLAGYEGDAAAIVWSGMTLKLPPAAN